MPDDPSVAARPAPFWIIALGAASIAFVAGFWAIVDTLGENPESHEPTKLVLPLLMLLAGGFVFGHFSRRRLWLVSLFLIVPNPALFLPLALLVGSLGDPPGSHGSFSAYALIEFGAFIAAPLIGVGLALALTRFRPPGPPDPPPGSPDPGISKKAAIVVAIIGVIISAVIAQILDLGLHPLDAGQALFLTSTISQTGGLLIFFFALLLRQK